ncbi:MAG: hypothetical protein LBR80_14145 [Deltaproteobacteria bacterium]|jgi:hypothetical protein|nr:hypothetical protein [Deltaproteobacteria bacterium]
MKLKLPNNETYRHIILERLASSMVLAGDLEGGSANNVDKSDKSDKFSYSDVTAEDWRFSSSAF